MSLKIKCLNFVAVVVVVVCLFFFLVGLQIPFTSSLFVFNLFLYLYVCD